VDWVITKSLWKVTTTKHKSQVAILLFFSNIRFFLLPEWLTHFAMFIGHPGSVQLTVSSIIFLFQGPPKNTRVLENKNFIL
jgi:hypothetical protein